MIAYVDASVVLRLVLGEPAALTEWPQIVRALASTLTEVECLRTLDRLVRRGMLPESQVAERRAAVFRLLEESVIIDLSQTIMRRSAEPFPTPLGTLAAMHLVCALAWRDASGEPLVLATHDRELATARADRDQLRREIGAGGTANGHVHARVAAHERSTQLSQARSLTFAYP